MPWRDSLKRFGEATGVRIGETPRSGYYGTAGAPMTTTSSSYMSGSTLPSRTTTSTSYLPRSSIGRPSYSPIVGYRTSSTTAWSGPSPTSRKRYTESARPSYR
jgi:hypothetical protein